MYDICEYLFFTNKHMNYVEEYYDTYDIMIYTHQKKFYARKENIHMSYISVSM